MSVLDGDNLTDVTGTLDTSLYASGAQVQISVDVDGITRLETITLQPTTTPVSVTSTRGDINNGVHTFTVTASDSQSVTIESLTPAVATIANNQISVLQDGVARFAVTANDGTWQEVVSLDVLSPRAAPSIDWVLDADGDLQVANITGDYSYVALTYQGADSSLGLVTQLVVDRNASDTIVWAVKKGGVRYSEIQSVDVAAVVNPLAINNLSVRVADATIADADVFAEFMGLTALSSEATTLSLYRHELENNPVTTLAALESTIANVNTTATAFIDLQATPNANITITQIQTLLPSQYITSTLLTEYQTALASNVWNTPDEVQALIVVVNNDNAVDSDGDGIFDGVELAQFTDPNDANHPIYLGGQDTDNDTTLNALDTDLDGDGTLDSDQILVTMTTGVLAGNVDGLPIAYATGSSDACPASANPSQVVGNIALASMMTVMVVDSIVQITA
ncbi:internalin putative [Vibrio ponticus]|nr:internalin putative [Vibrio ponticus]